MLTGGCYCGAIRYQVDGEPYHSTNCHCTMCRRTTGAPFVTWFSVKSGEFQLVKGAPTEFRSSARASRSFCPVCGTQLSFQHDDALDEIDITTCSLDDPEGVPPGNHIYTSSRLRWIKCDDGLPEYAETRQR